ncbi:MAG: DUF2913 family protein [Endozoicomonadaceae bacterium]|nr:DUF2913 family protein [Endozoicomonadaceae bacterium]
MNESSSSKTQRERILELAENSLLFLYLKCADEVRFTPLKRRNEWLIQHFKPMVKCDEHKAIRKDVKLLIHGGRKNTINIENELLKLRSLMSKYSNDVDRFYGLLSAIEGKLALQSCMFETAQSAQKNKIYLLNDHIDNGFNNDGIQVAPLALIVNSSKWNLIEDIIKQHGHFTSEVTDSTELKATIYLHPQSRNIDVQKSA